MRGARTAACAVLAAIATCSVGPSGRAAAEAPAGRAAAPVALLLAGGGFIYDDATRMASAAALARAAGFQPRYVDYPEYDLRAAVGAAQRAAQKLRARGRAVYAYGDSAGGTLAALLAERHLVAAAATYSPVANMRRFANHLDDPELYKALIGADDSLLLRDSPGLHDSDRPIFAMRPVLDSAFMNNATSRWDARDPEVSSVPVPGGHLGGGDPAIYGENAERALAWLARRASGR